MFTLINKMTGLKVVDTGMQCKWVLAVLITTLDLVLHSNTIYRNTFLKRVVERQLFFLFTFYKPIKQKTCLHKQTGSLIFLKAILLIRYAKMLVCLIMFPLTQRDYHQEYNSLQDILQHIVVHHEILYILYIFLERCNKLRQK